VDRRVHFCCSREVPQIQALGDKRNPTLADGRSVNSMATGMILKKELEFDKNGVPQYEGDPS